MKIIKYPAPILRQTAVEVEPTELNQLQTLIKDMIEITMLNAGQGLAAPQVGVNKRVIVYRNEDKFCILINPVITASSGKITSLREGCLSIPNIRRDIKRARYVTIEGLDEKGNPVTIYTKQPTMSIVLQHEIDHLNGITILQGRRKYRLNNSKKR